ncbi:uncharacterized protein LOC134801147 isoform X2 [Cydia splendana]|uniref:uncharacterized protein LOC134801147 isoform X2 n=1 Tax=Cydia splendana TaxID=1100963 RepID=UPI00300C58B1
MISHPNVATRHPKENVPAWVKITRHLNSIGTARSMKAWWQTWKDLKNRIRSRVHAKNRSCGWDLHGFRQRKLRILLGMTPRDRQTDPETDIDQPETDGETLEEYSKPESEVAVAPRAPSPRSVLYNLAEILARNSPKNENRETNKKSTPETSVSNETNDILRELVLELKRSNELKAEQNCHLKDMLQQLKTPTCTHTSQHTDIPTPTDDSQTDNALDVQKQEDTLDHVTEDQCNGVANDEEPAGRAPAPVIRPVALSSLTSTDTPGPQYKRVKVQSIVKGEPRTMARRIIRLKDGSVLLMPTNMKTQADKDGDQLYVVCARKRR